MARDKSEQEIEYCFPCEILDGKLVKAKHKVYVESVGEQAHVCNKHYKEYTEDIVKININD